MLLSNALKRKNRTVKRIKEIEEDIISNNSLPTVSQREIDVEKILKERDILVQELISLKLKIFVASEPIRENILKIAELKSNINFLKSISTKKGIVRELCYHGSENVEYKTIIEKKEITELIKSSEEEIDTLQDEIDKHNHTVEIE